MQSAKRLITQAASPLLRPANRVLVRRRYAAAAQAGHATQPIPTFAGRDSAGPSPAGTNVGGQDSAAPSSADANVGGPDSVAPTAAPVLLCFPHVDDETIAAGGLLLAWQAQNVPVDLVYLTDSSAGGVGASPAARAQARRAEAEELARRTGIRELYFLPGTNEHLLPDVPAVTAALTSILQAGNYGAVFTVGPLDAHHEHRECAGIVAASLRQANYGGPVFVCENSNLLPIPLVTHHHTLSRANAAARAGLFGVFGSQVTMGFAVYEDLARAKAPLVPGAHALELFQQTTTAGFGQLVAAAAATKPPMAQLLEHRIGNSWSLRRALHPDAPIMAALTAAGWGA